VGIQLRAVNLTAHVHLVTRLRMNEDEPSLTHTYLKARCLINEAKNQLLL
jgi:hypothetical protein